MKGILEIFWDRGYFHGKTDVLGRLLCGIWLIAMALIGGMTGRLKGVSVGLSLGLALFFWEYLFTGRKSAQSER